MNRALLLTLFFVACGPERVEPELVVPPVDSPPATTTAVDPLTGFPCDVREVLQANCASCHAGAQYVTHFDSREEVSQLGEKISQRLLPGAGSPMPPAGVAQQPTVAERQLLDGWLQSGMPAGACGPLTRN